MRDKISVDRVKLLHPKVRVEVHTTIDEIEAFWPLNVCIRVVQGLRTIDEQNALYAQGRTKPGKIVTKATGGKSYHNYGIAFDFALMYDKDTNGTYETLSWDENDPHWKEVVKAFEAKGWFWGGNFSTIHDAPHLEKSFGFKVAELLDKYTKQEFIAGTKYLKI